MSLSQSNAHAQILFPYTHGVPKLSTRYLFLDEMRGLAILNMIFFHLFWNIDSLLDIPLPWYHTFGARAWQLYICGSFLLLAGLCIHYTRHLSRHILTLAASALLITIVTWFAGSQTLIVFGILHCMTLCFLCYVVLRPLLQKIPAVPGLIVTLIYLYLSRASALSRLRLLSDSAAVRVVSLLLAIPDRSTIARFPVSRLFSDLPLPVPIPRGLLPRKIPPPRLDAQIPLPPARMDGSAQPNNLSASSAHPIWCDDAIFPRITRALQAICGAFSPLSSKTVTQMTLYTVPLLCYHSITPRERSLSWQFKRVSNK